MRPWTTLQLTFGQLGLAALLAWSAAAAAIAGLIRCVRPPGPCRP